MRVLSMGWWLGLTWLAACAPVAQAPASAPRPAAVPAAAGPAQVAPAAAPLAQVDGEPAKESGCIYADEGKPVPKPEGCPHEEAATTAPPALEPGHFGAALSTGEATPLGRALAGEVADGAALKVSGTIDQVCQKMGCWLVLKDGEQNARVLMKDHGFTVPLDSKGKAAVVEGTIKVRTFTEGQVKHLEEDAGRDASKVAGPRREFVLTASGIRIQG